MAASAVSSARNTSPETRKPVPGRLTSHGTWRSPTRYNGYAARVLKEPATLTPRFVAKLGNPCFNVPKTNTRCVDIRLHHRNGGIATRRAALALLRTTNQ